MELYRFTNKLLRLLLGRASRYNARQIWYVRGPTRGRFFVNNNVFHLSLLAGLSLLHCDVVIGVIRPRYSARGRIRRLSSSCSITCAVQPLMRETAKTGVNKFLIDAQRVVGGRRIKNQHLR